MTAPFDLNDPVVVVIGSGAGGGTVANELTQRGIDVVCLEAGSRLSLADVVNDPPTMNARMGWELEEGRLSPADASAVKVYGTECLIEIYRLLVEVVGPTATVQGDTAAEELAAQLEVEYRGCTINTFGGGVNEIQREIVAMLGLGLPRAAR